MTHDESNAWRIKEIASTNYRKKLRQARERKGWSQEEAMGDTGESYHDIENSEGDLTSGYSLAQIKNICEKLGIHPRELFCDDATIAISISDFVGKIKIHCAQIKLPIGEFEDAAGWRLENSIANPDSALSEWNIDCVIDISRELGLDWRGVIAGL